MPWRSGRHGLPEAPPGQRIFMGAVLEKRKQGRECYRRGAWAQAYQALSLADQASPLDVEDLELLAASAYLIGREEDFLRILDRAHRGCLNRGESRRAARCGFWLGLVLLLRGEAGRATGWLARARRLLGDHDCVEQGYLLLPAAEQHLAEGDSEAAHAVASRAASLGERFREPDLVACARHLQGRAVLRQGQHQAGLALLDEAMVAVSASELSPIVTGLIYCSVIEACQQAYALSRAREWTSAMAQWCAEQPELVAFTTTCLVRRAEVLQLQGAWPDAMREARRACERFSGSDARPPAAAFYQKGELHRLRGEFAEAEEAYRSASQGGCEPQPGLALLRLAQGRTGAAGAAIRRVMSAAVGSRKRLELLPAFVEILVAVGDLEQARASCRELEEIAKSFDAPVPAAMAAQARGAVELAEGRARNALGPLRRAWEVWERAELPYPAARMRVLMGLACRALGDEEGGELELQAARGIFERLGAAPDLARLDALGRHEAPGRAHALSPRELQVLRLVATGMTNKAIARELCLSKKTIDRHVSNIFTKLDVPSRAAATAYAYEHDLI